MTRISSVMCLSLLVLTASMASTAPGAEPRGGARGMLAGMMGGGGLNLLATAGIPEVQKRAGLSEAQISAVAELREKSQEAMRKLFADMAGRGGGGGDQMAVVAKIREKLQAQQKEINDELKQVLKEKHPKLVELAAGLVLRQTGPAALATKEVAELVGLKKEATEQIDKIVAASREQTMEMVRGMAGQDRNAIGEKLAELRKETNAKVGKLVTEGQKKKIDELMAAVEGIEPPRGLRGGSRGGGRAGGGPD